MSDDLKPCPFCEDDQAEYRKRSMPLHGGDTRVVCMLCLAEGPLGMDEEDAADGWNDRRKRTP
ncbi:hypothetical protein LCGC14_0782760 [marine sediment metagenome]|uniref:Restriction alleviation protein, Lar family n=1 Tax=marine sediment metagenome TaxID=412755 RepID=A0A0F9QEW9_9ZZZZ